VDLSGNGLMVSIFEQMEVGEKLGMKIYFS
jgi:hypothetical protein